MNATPIAAFARLPTPTSVHGLLGKISKLFPRETPTGWSYQNGFVKDEGSGAEVRVMFKNWPEEIKPAEFEGGYIELAATDDVSMVWKSQRAKGTRPVESKIEILPSAAVVRLVPSREYHGPRAKLPAARVATPVTTGPRVGGVDADPPIPFPSAQTRGERVPSGDPILTVQRGLLQIAALRLISRETAELLFKNEARTPAAGEDLATAVEREAQILFEQAAKDGLHRHLDCDTFWRERNVTVAAMLATGATSLPPMGPNVAKIAELIGGDEKRERRANAVLAQADEIAAKQTWRDLTDEQAGRILGQGLFAVAVAS